MDADETPHGGNIRGDTPNGLSATSKNKKPIKFEDLQKKNYVLTVY